jgi:hypothetical protein
MAWQRGPIQPQLSGPIAVLRLTSRNDNAVHAPPIQSEKRQTGTNQALARAFRLIVCTYPPENGGQIHTILNEGEGHGLFKIERYFGQS